MKNKVFSVMVVLGVQAGLVLIYQMDAFKQKLQKSDAVRSAVFNVKT